MTKGQRRAERALWRAQTGRLWTACETLDRRAALNSFKHE